METTDVQKVRVLQAMITTQRIELNLRDIQAQFAQLQEEQKKAGENFTKVLEALYVENEVSKDTHIFNVDTLQFQERQVPTVPAAS